MTTSAYGEGNKIEIGGNDGMVDTRSDHVHHGEHEALLYAHDRIDANDKVSQFYEVESIGHLGYGTNKHLSQITIQDLQSINKSAQKIRIINGSVLLFAFWRDFLAHSVVESQALELPAKIDDKSKQKQVNRIDPPKHGDAHQPCACRHRDDGGEDAPSPPSYPCLLSNRTCQTIRPPLCTRTACRHI